MLVFFIVTWIIMIEYVPPNQMMNHNSAFQFEQNYKEAFKKETRVVEFWLASEQKLRTGVQEISGC